MVSKRCYSLRHRTTRMALIPWINPTIQSFVPQPQCTNESYFCYLPVGILESGLILVTAAGAVINAEHRFGPVGH